MPKKTSRSSRSKTRPRKTFVGSDGKPFFCRVCMARKVAQPLAYPPIKITICLERPQPIRIANVGKKTIEAWKWEYQELVLCKACAVEVLTEFDPKTTSLW